MSIYRTRYFDQKVKKVHLCYVVSLMKRSKVKAAMENAFPTMKFLSMRQANEKECTEINSMFY